MALGVGVCCLANCHFHHAVLTAIVAWVHGCSALVQCSVEYSLRSGQRCHSLSGSWRGTGARIACTWSMALRQLQWQATISRLLAGNSLVLFSSIHDPLLHGLPWSLERVPFSGSLSLPLSLPSLSLPGLPSQPRWRTAALVLFAVRGLK